MIETHYEFMCPYCGENLSILLDASGGQKQSFVYDCEVCCRPIDVNVRFDGDEIISFSAETDDR